MCGYARGLAAHAPADCTGDAKRSRRSQSRSRSRSAYAHGDGGAHALYKFGGGGARGAGEGTNGYLQPGGGIGGTSSDALVVSDACGRPRPSPHTGGGE